MMRQVQRLALVASAGTLLSCAQGGEPELDSTSQASGTCAAPLDVAYCEQLFEAGIVNVRCPIDTTDPALPFDANGSYAAAADFCDDTEGLRAALAKAGPHRKVMLPVGTGRQCGSGSGVQPYLISEPIDVSGRRLEGGGSSVTTRATIALAEGASLTAPDACTALPLSYQADVATTCKPGSMLYAVNQATHIENINLMASDTYCDLDDPAQADFTLFLYNADGSVIREQRIQDARQAAFWAEASAVDVSDIEALCNNRHGMAFVDPDSANIDIISGKLSGNDICNLITSDDFDSTGLLFAERPNASGAFNRSSHNVYATRMDAEQNIGPGLLVTNFIGPMTLQGTWVETAYNAVQVYDSENVFLSHGRSMYPGEGYHSYDLENCKHCAVVSNFTGGSTPSAFSIRAAEDNRYLDAHHNVYWGSKQAGPIVYPLWPNQTGVAIEMESGSGTARLSQHLRTALGAWTPPAAGAGVYDKGDVVWKIGAGNGPQPSGWGYNGSAWYELQPLL